MYTTVRTKRDLVVSCTIVLFNLLQYTMQKEQYPKIAYKFKLHFINVFITITMIEEKMGLEAMR